MTSCPDPQGGYDEFLGRTEDARIISDAAPEVDVSTGDFSGTYLMGVGVVIDPDPPLMIQVTVVVEGEGENRTADFSFQPIKTDNLAPPPIDTGGPRPDARTPVGDAISVNDVPVAEGQFEITLTQIVIEGEANPVTFRQITADLVLAGFVTSDSAFCGTVTGDVTDPIPLPLDGSNFGAVEADDPTTVETVPFDCDTVGGGGGTGEGTN